jgi:hypothetical protein
VNKVKTIAHNNHFQVVLDTFRTVAIGLATNPFDLFDLVGFAGGLNVFEVNFSVLAEIDDGAKEVEKTFVALKTCRRRRKKILSKRFYCYLGRTQCK